MIECLRDTLRDLYLHQSHGVLREMIASDGAPASYDGIAVSTTVAG